MTLERREGELLALVANDRDEKCGGILREARERSRVLLAEAHHLARQRVRDAFAQERRLADDRIGAARARLQTHQRLAEQRRARALLALAWQRLHQELRTRWRDAALREAWIATVVAQARSQFSGQRWHLAHPTDWPVAERASLAATLRRDGIEVELVEDGRIDAGVLIRCAGNLIDGTHAGLVADQDDVGARLLFELERGP